MFDLVLRDLPICGKKLAALEILEDFKGIIKEMYEHKCCGCGVYQQTNLHVHIYEEGMASTFIEKNQSPTQLKFLFESKSPLIKDFFVTLCAACHWTQHIYTAHTLGFVYLAYAVHSQADIINISRTGLIKKPAFESYIWDLEGGKQKTTLDLLCRATDNRLESLRTEMVLVVNRKTQKELIIPLKSLRLLFTNKFDIQQTIKAKDEDFEEDPKERKALALKLKTLRGRR